MNYKTLGRSGLRVSPICLGGMTLGDDWGWGADEVESEKIIKRFMGLGGNFIDTANVYTNNHSEKIIGNVIGRNSSIRAGMVLATKFGMNVFPGNPNGFQTASNYPARVTTRRQSKKPTRFWFASDVAR